MGSKLFRLMGAPANADWMPGAKQAAATRTEQVYLPLVRVGTAEPVIYYPWHGPKPIQTQGYKSGHPAYDFATPSYTPMYAPFAGRITYHNESGYAYCLKITNDAYQLQTLLAHMPADAQRRVGLASGDMVAAGQLVGYSDNTGYSTGPHIHWEVRRPNYCGYACCLDFWRYTRAWDGQPAEPPPPPEPEDPLHPGDPLGLSKDWAMRLGPSTNDTLIARLLVNIEGEIVETATDASGKLWYQVAVPVWMREDGTYRVD